MAQSGGILGDLLVALPQAMFLAGKEALKKGISLAPKLAPILAEKATQCYINKGINEVNKKFASDKGSGTTLTNNEIKYIMKVLRSFENRRILLKETTRKTTGQERGFLSFHRTLMTAYLPLMKTVLIQLAKNVLLPFGLSAGMSATDAVIQKKIYGLEITAIIISNEEMKDLMN